MRSIDKDFLELLSRIVDRLPEKTIREITSETDEYIRQLQMSLDTTKEIKKIMERKLSNDQS